MKKLKRNDLILFGAVLSLSFLIFLIYRFFPATPGQYVVITVDEKQKKMLPLNQDTTYVIRSDTSSNTLQIKNGYASIIKADCPDKLCVHQHKISKKGEMLVCLPHKLVISITSSDNGTGQNSKEDFDGIAK